MSSVAENKPKEREEQNPVLESVPGIRFTVERTIIAASELTLRS